MISAKCGDEECQVTILSPNSDKCWYFHLIMSSAVTIVLSANTFMPSVARTNASFGGIKLFCLINVDVKFMWVGIIVAHINL